MKETTKNLQFAVCGQPTPEVPVLIEPQHTGKPWVYYGTDNKYPEYLWSLFTRSALLQSIISGTTDYVLGNDVIAINPTINADHINDDGETLEDIIKLITNDYLIFGGFSIQVIFNKLGKVSELYWLDFRNCRIDEDKQKVYYSEEWTKKSSPKYVEYDVLDTKKRKGTAVVYFRGHNCRSVYPLPRYSGALNALETSTEIARYHLNAIHNNFNGNLVINFNNGEPSDDVKKEIEKKIKNKFAGAENGGAFLVSFNDSKDNGVTIERLQDDNTDKKYEQLRKDTYKEIFIAFRCQPQLFGFVIEGSLFNKEEYQQAFELYKKTVVKPIQQDIIRVFNKVYDTDKSINFQQFKLNDNDNESDVNQ